MPPTAPLRRTLITEGNVWQTEPVFYLFFIGWEGIMFGIVSRFSKTQFAKSLSLAGNADTFLQKVHARCGQSQNVLGETNPAATQSGQKKNSSSYKKTAKKRSKENVLFVCIFFCALSVLFGCVGESC